MFRSILPHQAHELLQRGDVEVIDVRDPAEWSSGHLPMARLIPLEKLRTVPVSEWRGRASVLFVCAAGVRSQTAARLASQLGVENAYSLTGGTRAWIKAGLPLTSELQQAV